MDLLDALALFRCCGRNLINQVCNLLNRTGDVLCVTANMRCLLKPLFDLRNGK